MSDTIALSFRHLSDLSEELHLILGKEKEILFANKALKLRIENIHSTNDIYQSLGITESYSISAIEECLLTGSVLEILVELPNETTTIHWKIVASSDTLTFIGKDLGN